MKDKEEGKFYTRLECMFVAAVTIDKVIKEDRIVMENLWDVAGEVSE